MIRPSFSDL